MKILMAGDIVGSAGRMAFARTVAELKREKKVDFVVANAENAAAGKGLTTRLAEEILASGADVLTLGDHVWDQKETETLLESEPRVLRAANLPSACPGKGMVTVDTDWGRITVICLLGRVFMNPCDSPFAVADQLLSRKSELGPIILADFHAEATSEKCAMGYHLDGRVTALVGTHTHVQTSDEYIMPRGSAYITDLGMTGPKDSIIGCEPSSVMPVFLKAMKSRFAVSKDVEKSVLEGVLIDVKEATGKATSIRRIRK